MRIVWRQVTGSLRRPAISEILAAGAIVFLFATNVYRAWTQSITHDEANTYEEFLTGPIARIFTTYRANNHVAQSLLSGLAVRWFGLSEFSLRLPSLLGSALYLGVVWQLSRYLYGRRWLVVLSVAALGLNPFLLDYYSAARGYGLGLAFLLWAFYELLRWLEEGAAAGLRLYRAGIALGLAVAANLVFAVPAAALAGLALLAAVADSELGGEGKGITGRFWGLVDQLAGPAIVTGFVFLAVPLTRLRGNSFYYARRRSTTSPTAWWGRRCSTTRTSGRWGRGCRAGSGGGSLRLPVEWCRHSCWRLRPDWWRPVCGGFAGGEWRPSRNASGCCF